MGIWKSYLSERKNRLRLFFFVLAFVAAVTFITLGVVRMGHREEGYYAVEAAAEAQIVTYDSGVQLYYYAQGGSNEIKVMLQAVSRVYSDALLYFDKLLDARETYEGMNNLATLNQHPGEVFEIDDSLYRILKDALERTEREPAYSMFAGALYGAWNTICYLENPEDFDPLLNEEQAMRLQALTQLHAQPGAFTLTLTDGAKKTACLTIGREAERTLKALESDDPVLDLNLLRDAYVMDGVAERLRAAGRTNGYLTSSGGLSMVLGGTDVSYALLGVKEGESHAAASVHALPGTVCCQFNAFGNGQGYGAYTIRAEDETWYRHAWLNAESGQGQDWMLSCMLIGQGKSACAVKSDLLSLLAQSGVPGMEASLERLDGIVCAACIQKAAPQTVIVWGTNADIRAGEGYSLLKKESALR